MFFFFFFFFFFLFFFFVIIAQNNNCGYKLQVRTGDAILVITQHCKIMFTTMNPLLLYLSGIKGGVSLYSNRVYYTGANLFRSAWG